MRIEKEKLDAIIGILTDVKNIADDMKMIGTIAVQCNNAEGKHDYEAAAYFAQKLLRAAIAYDLGTEKERKALAKLVCDFLEANINEDYRHYNTKGGGFDVRRNYR